MFAIAPLDWIEWKAVLLLSAPVVLIDEVLKLLTVRLQSENSIQHVLIGRCRPHLFLHQPRSRRTELPKGRS
jgi:hypothetical protein